MKRVHAATNLPEAQLLVDQLGAHGIPARILNANAASLAGELPVDVARPQVWIDRDADYARAKPVVEAYLRPVPEGPAVKCAKCGEESPASFDFCWKCGAALAG